MKVLLVKAVGPLSVGEVNRHKAYDGVGGIEYVCFAQCVLQQEAQVRIANIGYIVLTDRAAHAIGHDGAALGQLHGQTAGYAVVDDEGDFSKESLDAGGVLGTIPVAVQGGHGVILTAPKGA